MTRCTIEGDYVGEFCGWGEGPGQFIWVTAIVSGRTATCTWPTKTPIVSPGSRRKVISWAIGVNSVALRPDEPAVGHGICSGGYAGDR